MTSVGWTIRLSPVDDERLTRQANARGVTRAAYVRRLLREADDGAPDAPADVVDRDELLRLLSEKARSGHHGAMVTLSHLLAGESDDGEEAEPDPFAALDEFAARRETRRPPRSAA